MDTITERTLRMTEGETGQVFAVWITYGVEEPHDLHGIRLVNDTTRPGEATVTRTRMGEPTEQYDMVICGPGMEVVVQYPEPQRTNLDEAGFGSRWPLVEGSEDPISAPMPREA